MPLYLDIHNKVEGLTAPAVSDAHAADLGSSTSTG